MDFIGVGKKIGTYINVKTPKVTIRLDKNAIKELSEKDTKLKDIIGDVFVDSRHPSVEFTIEDKGRRTVVSMVTKENDEVLFDNNFIVKDGKSLVENFPELSGRTKSITLNKDDISELLKDKDNNEFAKYLYMLLSGKPITENEKKFINFIHQSLYNKDEIKLVLDNYLAKVENPSLEIAEKSLKNGKITIFRLKDGDTVISQGAFSKTTDSTGNKVSKYHISSANTTSTGCFCPGKVRNQSIDKLGFKLQQAMELVGLYKLGSREKAILEYKFGLNGNKKYSNKVIGDFFGLTRERVRMIVNEAKLNLLKENIDDYKLKIYEFAKVVPKYLDNYEASSFKLARFRAMYRDENALDQIKTFFELSKVRSKKAVYNALHDIKPSEEEVPMRVDDIFIAD